MNTAKEDLAKIVDAHELPDDARIALEKLVTGLVNENKADRQRLTDTSEEMQIVVRHQQNANASASRLAVEKESLSQRLRGKDDAIARLEKKMEMLSEDLIAQRGKGYNVPMIRDFLEQLRFDIAGSLYENQHYGAFEPDEQDVIMKYQRRYGNGEGRFLLRI